MKTALALLVSITLCSSFCYAKDKDQRSVTVMAKQVAAEAVKDVKPQVIGYLKMVTRTTKISGVTYSVTWSQFLDDEPTLTIVTDTAVFKDYNIDGKLSDKITDAEYAEALVQITSHFSEKPRQEYWVRNP